MRHHLDRRSVERGEVSIRVCVCRGWQEGEWITVHT